MCCFCERLRECAKQNLIDRDVDPTPVLVNEELKDMADEVASLLEMKESLEGLLRPKDG